MKRLNRHIPDTLMILGGLCIPAGIELVGGPAFALLAAGLELLLAGLLLTIGGKHGPAR